MDRSRPQVGFFKLHLSRGEVAAQIACNDGTWSAWIDGRLIADPSPFPMAARVFLIWHNAERVNSTEYRRLLGNPSQLEAA